MTNDESPMTDESILPPVHAVPPIIEHDPAAVLDQLAPKIRLLQAEIAKVIIGQEEVILAALYALFARAIACWLEFPGWPRR